MTLACLGGTAKRLCKQQDGNDGSEVNAAIEAHQHAKAIRSRSRIGGGGKKKKKKCLPGLTEAKRRRGKEGMAVGLRLS